MVLTFAPDQLRLARKSCNFTQEELGVKLGCSQRRISSLEQGWRSPTIEGLGALAQALDVDITVLVRWNIVPESDPPASLTSPTKL